MGVVSVSPVVTSNRGVSHIDFVGEYQHEYIEADDDESSRDTCYIEAKHGQVSRCIDIPRYKFRTDNQTFVVCIRMGNDLRFHERRYDWSMHCTVDGLDIGAETVTKQNRTARFSSMHLRQGEQDYSADLVFGHLV
jgi:hypothetical protein